MLKQAFLMMILFLYSYNIDATEKTSVLEKIFGKNNPTKSKFTKTAPEQFYKDNITEDILNDRISGIYDKIEEIDNKLQQMQQTLHMMEGLLVLNNKRGGKDLTIHAPDISSKGRDIPRECLSSIEYKDYMIAFREFQEVFTDNSISSAEKIRPLSDFINRNKNAVCSSVANFWIGEVFWEIGDKRFADGDYDSALDNFRIAVNYTRKSNKIHSDYNTPLRIMKTITAQKNLGNILEACNGLIGLESIWLKQNYDKFLGEEFSTEIKEKVKKVKSKVKLGIIDLKCMIDKN